jgi:hypothetical protein
MSEPTISCNGEPCTTPGEECDVVLGAGRDDDLDGSDCGLHGGHRYIVDGQPSLAAAFDCIGRTGVEGDGYERQAEAILAAIGELSQPGACNAGFLRDDAVLVVTIVSDEEDDPNDGNDGDENSPGDPQDWYDAIVAAKHGDPSAVVVLGLVGDTDLPMATCGPITDVSGAEPAPRLRELVEMFGDRGIWASVCSPDYAPFFAQAVELIDTACDEFEPPG